MSIEEKQAILKSAGYQLAVREFNWDIVASVFTPDEWRYDEIEYGGDSETSVAEVKSRLLTKIVDKAWDYYHKALPGCEG